MMTMRTLMANHTPPSTPHKQWTSPSLPKPGRSWQHQNSMFGATTTTVTNLRISYVEVLPRLPHTLQMMPSSTSLSTMMTDTHNQSLLHLTLPFYKSGMTSAPNSTTSSLNLLNSAMNTITQPIFVRTMQAPPCLQHQWQWWPNSKWPWLHTISSSSRS